MPHVGSGILNLLQLLVIVKVVALLREAGQTESALFYSNAVTIVAAALTTATFKIEYHGAFASQVSRWRLLVLAGVLCGIGSMPIVTVVAIAAESTRGVHYAGSIVGALVLAAAYQAFVLEGKFLLATVIKGAPFVFAGALAWAAPAAVGSVLAGVFAVVGVTAVAAAIAWRSLVTAVIAMARSESGKFAAALLGVLANNVVFISIQWLADPEVALDYFEHLRLFVGPVTFALFPLGQAITKGSLTPGERKELGKSGSVMAWALLAIYVATVFPAYLVVDRVVGVGVLRGPSWFMYCFVLATNIPRVLASMWLPYMLAVALHRQVMASVVLRIVGSIVVLAYRQELDMYALAALGVLEMGTALYLMARLRIALRTGSHAAAAAA